MQIKLTYGVTTQEWVPLERSGNNWWKLAGDFLDADNVLFVELGGNYTGMFILWKFIEV